MNADFLSELRRLWQVTAHLQEVAAGLQAPPSHPIEREDRSGAIFLRLGKSGVPDRIRVVDDWAQRIPATHIGHAVVEAFELAVSERMQIWAAQLEGARWQERLSDLDLGKANPPAAHDHEAVPHSLPHPSEVPSMDRLAEEAISLLSEADEVEAPAKKPPEARVGPSRRVVISISDARLNVCEVDVRWARRQSARSLAAALNSALHRPGPLLKNQHIVNWHGICRTKEFKHSLTTRLRL